MTVTHIFAIVALLLTSGCNFYVAGLLHERYNKVPWVNVFTGVFLLGCALKSAM